jgi:hypothetical protein
MIRHLNRFSLLFLGLAWPLVAWGQGVVVSPKTVLGTTSGVTRPIPSATITVCAANTPGLPCSPPLASTLFKDAALTQPLSNPFTADPNGNYQFAIAGGNYTVTESAAGFVGYSYQLTANCSPGVCTITTLTATGNITGNQFISTVSTGTPPLVVSSATQVANLNASQLGGLNPPSSAILGLTDTQSPANKNLITASNGNTVTLLNAQPNAAAITGTGSAATVYSYTLPANTVANLKGVRITAAVNHSSGTASTTYALTLNGITISSTAAASTGPSSAQWTLLSTASTMGTFSILPNGFLAPGTVGSLTGLAWTSSQALTLTFNVAATDQVTPIQWLVELIQ